MLINSSNPSHYLEYTNPSGAFYSSANDDDRTYFGFFEASFTNSGKLVGIFDGSVTTAGGAFMKIAEGNSS